MPYVLITHEVESYPAWKIVFDQAKDIRKIAGELSYQLLSFENNQNHVVHFSKWTSIEDAKRFFESPALIELRRQAGVKQPTFNYLHEIEQDVL
jgi:quinol monooxygenase YgiN